MSDHHEDPTLSPLTDFQPHLSAPSDPSAGSLPGLPAPVAGTDVFDFLWTPEPSPGSDDLVTVSEPDPAGLVEVTIQRLDGRSVSRRLPAESWQDQKYREAYLRSVCMLLA